MADYKGNDRLVRWFLYPTLIINFIVMIVVSEYRMAGFIYLVMDGFALVIFSTKRFKEEVYGLRGGLKDWVIAGGVGIGTAITFLIVSRIAPFFSMFTPTIPYSVGTDIRTFVICFIAPACEEIWRSSMLGSFRDVYRTGFWKANIFQAVIFAGLHLLAYGVFLGGLAHWSEVYGQFLAIAGALTAALIFGLISGVLMHKTKNVTPSIIAHAIINGYLVLQGLIIIS